MDAKKRAMINALELSLGVVTTACKQLGFSRQTHYNWMEKDKEYREAVNDIDSIALDFAESQLHKQMKEGNTTATIFYLKAKGKNRGYYEKMELDNNVSINQVELNSKLNEALNNLAQKLIDE